MLLTVGPPRRGLQGHLGLSPGVYRLHCCNNHRFRGRKHLLIIVQLLWAGSGDRIFCRVPTGCRRGVSEL